MQFLGVIAAAVAAYVFSAIWYTALSKSWIAAAGIPVDAAGKPQGNGSPLPFVIGFVAQLLVAGMMRHLFAGAQITSLGAGMLGGFGVGAFLITPWVTMNYSFAMRKPALAVLDGVNAVVGCTIMGAVLTLFV